MDKKESTKNTNIKIKWFLFHFSSASTPLKSILAVNQISEAFVSLPLFILHFVDTTFFWLQVLEIINVFAQNCY